MHDNAHFSPLHTFTPRYTHSLDTTTTATTTMDLEEADLTAAQEWEQSLNATCNRLSTQYLNLLKSAAVAQDTTATPFVAISDPPPPPLAAQASLAATQCQLAAENISVAAAHLLSLIRTLKLSLLLTDSDTIDAQEELRIITAREATLAAQKEINELEQQILMQRQDGFE